VMNPKTEVIQASELEDLALRIFEVRNPTARRDYKRALRKYERALETNGHKEVRISDGSYTRTTSLGYHTVDADGQPEKIMRPKYKRPGTYGYHPYYRSGDYSHHAITGGLLADSDYNRDIRPTRVDEYAAVMGAGLWQDLLSDPITITTSGQVLNGQHRIAAASLIARREGRNGGADGWPGVENDPKFLVVWGVEPAEALYADGSRRTANDENVIARKLVASVPA
jgi:hypothetical protein